MSDDSATFRSCGLISGTVRAQFGVISFMVNQTSKDGMKFVVRTATEAAAIIAILEGIASEQIYTAISKPWSADLALSPILRQTVKTQISLNGELSHGIVS